MKDGGDAIHSGRFEGSRVDRRGRPKPIASAGAPPAWDDDVGPMPDWNLLGRPEPNVEFDQRGSW